MRFLAKSAGETARCVDRKFMVLEGSAASAEATSQSVNAFGSDLILERHYADEISIRRTIANPNVTTICGSSNLDRPKRV